MSGPLKIRLRRFNVRNKLPEAHGWEIASVYDKRQWSPLLLGSALCNKLESNQKRCYKDQYSLMRLHM